MAERKAGNVAFSVVVLLGLSAVVPVLTRAERLPIRAYTTANGLAADHITRIVQDSRGFLWFCTVEGLSRFDGYRFVNYGTEQGLPSRYVNDFLETRSGVYWIATNQGLCRFNPEPSPQANEGATHQASSRFVVYYPGDSPGKQSISALCEDRSGTIWCGTSEGLYRLDQINGEWVFSFVDIIQPAQIEDSLLVKAIIEDRRGALWITTRAGLYKRLPDGVVERYTAEEGLPVREITPALLEDREGRIWVGTGFGLYQLVADPKPGHSIVARVYTTKDGLAHNALNTLIQSSDGRLWAGSGVGLSESLPSMNQSTQRFRSYTQANGLSDALAGVMAQDRDGNLWIGTETGGAMKLALSGFTSYSGTDGLGSSRIQSIFENRAGELCVISEFINRFVSRFEGRRFATAPLTLPRGMAYWGWGWYQVVFQDREGEWWMPTGQGLVRYPGLSSVEQLTRTRPKAIYTSKNGLPADEIFRVFEVSDGDIWISTLGRPDGVLTRWERATNTFHRYSPADGIPEAAPTAFCEDASGNLWIGFYSGGLLRYSEGRFAPFTKEDGLPPGFIQAMYLDHARRLWIATGEGGVARVDDPGADHPRFITYTTAEGLSSNHATCVTEDQWGRIYIGTGRGVNRLDPATGRIKQYTTADGLASNAIHVAFRDRTGALWFGTLQGLSRFIPQADRPTSPPPILISALRIAGVAYPISELGASEIHVPELTASQNQIQIEFVGLSLAAGESLRYQYKLEGADAGWSAPVDQRTVNYANLSSGNYRFLVRAVSADGVVTAEPAVIAFKILPRLWQRWWFLALVISMIGLVIYALHRYRVARLLELERIRTRIATDLHDDLGSSLSQIAILSEVARDVASRGDARAEQQLSTIARIARESVDSMSDIVWAINPQRDWLGDLAGRMRRFVGEILPARGVEFQFTASLPERGIRLGADMRRQVFLIFKEGVNNIVRHSEATHARIALRIEGSFLVMTLNDNGKGFDPALVKRGQGLASMRRRAESLGGELQIATSSREGTTVTLRAPLTRRALRLRGIGAKRES